MNVCKHMFFLFFSNSNIKDSNLKKAMPVLLFGKMHNFQGQFKYKSKINKAMFMHILLMTLNK